MAKKYIDADKIRSEVERIQETGCESPISVCNDILSFIDFLQQEQPSIHDLDEASEKWCKENNKGIALCDDKKSHYLADGMDAFKAGAELAMQQLKGE